MGTQCNTVDTQSITVNISKSTVELSREIGTSSATFSIETLPANRDKLCNIFNVKHSKQLVTLSITVDTQSPTVKNIYFAQLIFLLNSVKH
jgi:hypothetical protein